MSNSAYQENDSLSRTDTANSTKLDSQTPAYKETKTDWKADWEEWDGLEVKVEESTASTPPQEPDLFRDMQPVVSATRKVLLRPREDVPNPNKFAVDPTFLTSQTNHELGEWPDESLEDRGWDEDLPELLQESRKMLREKRMMEREHRRHLLQSQARGNGGSALGATRIST